MVRQFIHVCVYSFSRIFLLSFFLSFFPSFFLFTPLLLCFFLCFGLVDRLRNRSGFLLLAGVIPRRPISLVQKGQPEPRKFDIYLDIVLQELRQLYLEGKPSRHEPGKACFCVRFSDMVHIY